MLAYAEGPMVVFHVFPLGAGDIEAVAIFKHAFIGAGGTIEHMNFFALAYQLSANSDISFPIVGLLLYQRTALAGRTAL